MGENAVPLDLAPGPIEVLRTCRNCQVLADEVGMLKRRLAEANARALPEAVGRSVGFANGRVKADDEKQMVPHGPRCACLSCKAGRAAAALEGA